MLIAIAIVMFIIVAVLLIVSLIEKSDDEKEIEQKSVIEKSEDTNKRLCSWIPKEGTVEWAQYVLDNYTTDYFKPVDITRAFKILDEQENNNK